MEVNASVLEGILTQLSLVSESIADGGADPSSIPYTLNQLLEIAIEHHASLLHINVGSPPMLRINNQLVPIGDSPISRGDSRKLLSPVISREQRILLYQGCEVECCYPALGTGFRVNLFLERGNLGASIRHMRSDIPTMENLGLAGSAVEQALTESSGLILLTGSPRCGKINTLAAMRSYINSSRSVRLVSLERPIQFWHQNLHSMMIQREVETDTESFAQGIQQAVLQDPDVITLTEMPDRETAEFAIRAAAGGHLVIAILDAVSSTRAIERLLSTFSEPQDSKIITRLANSLRMVVHQELVHRSDSRGLVPAFEVLVNTEEVRQELRAARVDQLTWLMKKNGMQTLGVALSRLVNAGIVTQEEALQHLASEEELIQGAATNSADKDETAAAILDDTETPLMSWL